MSVLRKQYILYLSISFKDYPCIGNEQIKKPPAKIYFPGEQVKRNVCDITTDGYLILH